MQSISTTAQPSSIQLEMETLSPNNQERNENTYLNRFNQFNRCLRSIDNGLGACKQWVINNPVPASLIGLGLISGSILGLGLGLGLARRKIETTTPPPPTPPPPTPPTPPTTTLTTTTPTTTTPPTTTTTPTTTPTTLTTTTPKPNQSKELYYYAQCNPKDYTFAYCCEPGYQIRKDDKPHFEQYYHHNPIFFAKYASCGSAGYFPLLSSRKCTSDSLLYGSEAGEKGITMEEYCANRKATADFG